MSHRWIIRDRADPKKKFVVDHPTSYTHDIVATDVDKKTGKVLKTATVVRQERASPQNRDNLKAVIRHVSVLGLSTRKVA